MDVKFLYFKGMLTGRQVKRFQRLLMLQELEPYTLYDKHTQKNAIDFVDKIKEKFPFRIHTIQTDNGT